MLLPLGAQWLGKTFYAFITTIESPSGSKLLVKSFTSILLYFNVQDNLNIAFFKSITASKSSWLFSDANPNLMLGCQLVLS